MRYLLFLTVLWVVVACSANTDPIPPVPTATVLSLSPTPLPVTPSAGVAVIETPTETTPLEAISTVESTNDSTDSTVLCEVAVYQTFQSVWEANGADAKCPTRVAEVGDGAVQAFTNGTMIWVSGSDEEPAFIYVLTNDGAWQRFEDVWQEGDMGRADLTPPAGLIEPERGFGLVWREQLGGADAVIGWGMENERGQEVVIQVFGEDTAIADTDRIYWLFPNGSWQ